MREHVLSTTSGGSLIGKISSYLQLVSRDPHSTAFVPLAEAYRQIGLLDDALEVALLGTRMLPHFSPGFATLGRIFGQLGRNEEAQAAYEQSLSIDRQGLSALIGLARLHLARGERAAARRILVEAAQYHPQDETIANILVALDLPRPWNKLAAAAVEPRDTPPATVPDEAEVSGGEPIPTATLAEIYLKQGLVEQALRVYQEIVRLDPGNVFAAHRLRELSPTSSHDAPPPAGDAVTDTAGSARPARAHHVLAILESWLQVVRQRKAHV